MPDPHVDANEEDLFDEVVSNYDRQTAAGEVVDRDALLEANPDIADRLQSYFDSMDMLGQFQFENMDAPDIFDSNAPDAESSGSTASEMSAHETIIEQQFDDIRGSIYEPGVLPDPTPPESKAAAPAPATPPSGKPAPDAADENQLVGAEFGRYHVERLLGHGMMGSVYLAKDNNLGREVALKIPKRSEVGRPEFIERFYREARSAATLDHPNICQIHDVGEINNTHYISMTFVDGKPLSALVDANTKSSQRKVAALIRKVSVAMYEAHRKGIVHRDLKPDNIMVDRRHEPIVMDFGLARQSNTIEEGRITRTGQLIGTPAYMSPEQVDGESDLIGPQTDIYALGVILFELLTGQLPFQGKLTQVLRKIATEEPPLMKSFREDINEGLEIVCQRMLKKSLDERYSSMSDVALELGALLKGKRPTGHSHSRRKSGRERSKTSAEQVKQQARSAEAKKASDEAKAAAAAHEIDTEEIQLMTMEAVQAEVDGLIAEGNITGAMQKLNAVTKLSGTAFQEYVDWAAAKLSQIEPPEEEFEDYDDDDSEMASRIESATRLLHEHEYHKAYKLLAKIPKDERDSKVLGLLKDARSKALLTDALSEEIGEALRKGSFPDDLRGKAERLLKLKPDHKLAARVIQDIDAARESGLFGKFKKKFGKK